MIAFLRALERTGKVCAAAADAGVDRTTAFARRKAHPDFAAAWKDALKRFEQRKKNAEAEEIAALRAQPPRPSAASRLPPSPSEGGGAGSGEETVASGGQVKRVGSGRWSTAREAIFFDELAATNNVSRSAKAAGVSYNAVLARRLKHPVFAAKWDAVAQSAKATINMHLLEETRKSFDPEQLLGEVTPRVTIDQAIKISQSGASKGRQDFAPDPFVEEAEAMDSDGIEAVRERILTKLRRLRQRNQREQLEHGWSLDESYDQMIPPGWVQGPDYVPKPPEPPVPSSWDDPYGDGTPA